MIQDETKEQFFERIGREPRDRIETFKGQRYHAYACGTRLVDSRGRAYIYDFDGNKRYLDAE